MTFSDFHYGGICKRKNSGKQKLRKIIIKEMFAVFEHVQLFIKLRIIKYVKKLNFCPNRKCLEPVPLHTYGQTNMRMRYSFNFPENYFMIISWKFIKKKFIV